MDTIRTLQSVASPALDGIFLAITNLGHEYAYVALLLIAYLVFDASRGRRLGIFVLLSFYANGLLKGWFDTPRPYLLDPTVLRSAAAQVTGPGAGFPSGHAQGAATFWGIASLYVRRRWFTALALLIIVLVSLSRIYLGVHLPIDVLGGLVLGAALVALALRFEGVDLDPPAWLLISLGLVLPLVFHLLLPTPDSGLVMGGLAGFITAPSILGYRQPRTWWPRILVGAVGLLLVFIGLFGSSALLPEAVKRDPLVDFVRYLLISYLGLLVAPALARLLPPGRS